VQAGAVQQPRQLSRVQIGAHPSADLAVVCSALLIHPFFLLLLLVRAAALAALCPGGPAQLAALVAAAAAARRQRVRLQRFSASEVSRTTLCRLQADQRISQCRCKLRLGRRGERGGWG
jgi:hypothetical protein